MPRRPDVPCAGCGTLLWSGRSSLPAGQRKCQPCRTGPTGWRQPKTCARCGGQFTPKVNTRRAYDAQKTCSIACGQLYRYYRSNEDVLDRGERERQRSQTKNRQRRAILRGVESEPYTLAEIATRDDYRCGLCGGQVAMSAERFDPLAPVIDHVVPLACGGSDLRDNVQLAHFFCNGSKGARLEVEPLARIG